MDLGIAETDTFRSPSWKDMLILQSTIPGYFSWRDTVHGSYLVQCVCLVFKEHSHKMDLEDMLKEVMKEMHLKFKVHLQTPESWNRAFIKKLYFNYRL